MWQPEEVLLPGFRERLSLLKARGAKPEAYLAAFLELANGVKREERTGWVDRKVPSPESVADHMYRMALMAMLTTNRNLDMALCVQIALVHDLAEAIVGDIPPYAPVSKEEKHRREEAAMAFIRRLLSKYDETVGNRLYDLWTQYEEQTSPEAEFVKDLDKMELLSQADEYQGSHPEIPLQEFQQVEGLIKSAEVKGWARGLHEWSGSSGLFRE